MNQKGVKSVFLIGPNYAAGKDMLAGVKSTFKGEIKGEEYTVWPSQLDFSAELSKARASGAAPSSVRAAFSRPRRTCSTRNPVPNSPEVKHPHGRCVSDRHG